MAFAPATLPLPVGPGTVLIVTLIKSSGIGAYSKKFLKVAQGRADCRFYRHRICS
jgi:hypothetical protein